MENQELRNILIKMLCTGDEIKMVVISSIRRLTITTSPYISDNGKKYIKANNEIIEIKDLFEYKGELYIFRHVPYYDRENRYMEFISFIEYIAKNGKSRA